MITASLLEISEIESSVIFISSTVKGNEMANLGNYQAAVDLFTQAINLDAKDFRFVHHPIASVHYTNITNLVQISGEGGGWKLTGVSTIWESDFQNCIMPSHETGRIQDS